MFCLSCSLSYFVYLKKYLTHRDRIRSSSGPDPESLKVKLWKALNKNITRSNSCISLHDQFSKHCAKQFSIGIRFQQMNRLKHKEVIWQKGDNVWTQKWFLDFPVKCSVLWTTTMGLRLVESLYFHGGVTQLVQLNVTDSSRTSFQLLSAQEQMWIYFFLLAHVHANVNGVIFI